MTEPTSSGIRVVDVGHARAGLAPIVLLHGLGNSLNFWGEIIPSLRSQTRVIAFDLPGFGESGRTRDGLSLHAVSSLIQKEIASRQLSGVCLVAHSMGSYVALDIAGRDCRLVGRVVLVDGALLRVDALLRSARAAARDRKLLLAVAAQFVGGIVPMNPKAASLIFRHRFIRKLTLWPYVAQPDKLDVDALSEALGHNGSLAVLRVLRLARGTPSLANLMRRVGQPTELVWGERDRLVSSEDVRDARTLMNVTETLMLENCGHWPMLERPAVLSQYLLQSAGR